MKCPECFKERCEHIIRRADGRREWQCKHGCGHTIFVPKEYITDEKSRKAWFSHGCDGCCSKINKGETTMKKEQRQSGYEIELMTDDKNQKLNVELAVIEMNRNEFMPMLIFENPDKTHPFFRMHLKEAIELKAVIDNSVLDFNRFLHDEQRFRAEETAKGLPIGGLRIDPKVLQKAADLEVAIREHKGKKSKAVRK